MLAGLAVLAGRTEAVQEAVSPRAGGWRAFEAKALAEAGCSAHQIQAITGHKSLEGMERYTRTASQSQMATDAILKLPIARVGKMKNKQNKTINPPKRVGNAKR